MTLITLTGNPLSTQTLYRNHGHVRFMTREGKARKEQYTWEAKSQWKNPPLTTQVALKIALFFGDKRRRDIDNYHKISLDALSGIVYADDSQIEQMMVTKHYDATNPRIEITL